MTKHFHCAFGLLAATGLLLGAPAQQGTGSQAPPQTGMMQGGMGTMREGMGPMQGQMGANAGTCPMCGGMMSGMQNPVGRSTAFVFLLPDMQSELGLSPTQTAELNRRRTEFINEEQKTSADIAESRRNMNALMNSGTANDVQVRSALTDLSNLQASRMFSAYKTAVDMKAMLTPQQHSRLETMTPAELRNAMMSHMTMNEMSQMMQIMRGSSGPGMMRGCMGPPAAPAQMGD